MYCTVYNNLVEVHCYGIDRTGQILEQPSNVKLLSCWRKLFNMRTGTGVYTGNSHYGSLQKKWRPDVGHLQKLMAAGSELVWSWTVFSNDGRGYL